ncbi:hypothetical protein [Streptomyces sp. NRRL F-5123]|uniref:hypothetical protein n=1 Tax=Streptomyces sp. NRRL F-5123 TaxID=1463856 RepID=UPI000AD5FE61|nr:hypothetical protein [Streptomyces sp. NRRL F-5123]
MLPTLSSTRHPDTRTRTARRAGPAVLGLAGGLGAAVPVTGAMAALGRVGDWPFGTFGALVVVTAGLLLAAPPMLLAFRAVRRRRHRDLRPVLVPVLLANTAATLLLALLLPFRWGALSCLLYCLPALCVGRGVLLRSRAAVLGALCGLLAVYALAWPVREMQQHVAAREWLKANGIPSRALAQVVVLPGTAQDPYRWDGKRLTAMFTVPVGGSAAWVGAETVTPGRADPCGPLLTGEGDAVGEVTPPCAADGPGLWFRGTEQEPVGYVLQRDGVTVALTGGMTPAGSAGRAAALHRAALRREITAAHPATDAELWSRGRSGPSTAAARLLL